MLPEWNLERVLHATEIESLERRIMELALERTGARSGALFLWDSREKALSLDFHVVEGITIPLPGARLRRRADGRPNGIAFHVFDANRAYLSVDTARDPHYARYFFDARSVVAVPIPYQERAIGVLSMSSRTPAAFAPQALDALGEIARAAAKFLRRAQLYRQSRKEDGDGQPFLIKGLSPEWLEVERRLERVSATDATVLIRGESGTGKDLVARAIHFNSARAQKPYHVVNCAAIPETLLESTLFGHVRGAFTGANFTKIGAFAKAHGGTLFLDEIGEIPTALQAKLLRALEQGEIEPLGSNQGPRRVDVRVLCATNRDLEEMVARGTFRDDLYFRVRVMTLELPPLRRYKDNLEVLAQVFVQQAAEKHRRAVEGISSQALAALAAYDFPGNVRELKNLLEHAVILAAGPEIGPEDLPAQVRSRVPPARARAAAARPRSLRAMREQWLGPLEREYLTELLQSARGNVREAARRAGVAAPTFYRLMSRRGIKLSRVTRS